MSERSELLARVRSAARQSAALPARLAQLPELTAEALRPILLDYIRERFLLRPEDCGSDELMELSEASLRRYIQLFRAGAIDRDSASQCSTASSTVVKKVLLMKAVQDDFGVRFTPAQSAGLTTVTALAREIVRQKRGGEVCSPN